MDNVTSWKIEPHTLAFVDPFGWSGVPMSTIRDLLSSEKCEVIFNFMYGSINRFITVDNPTIEQQFIELFGTDSDTCHQVYKYQASEFSGDQRKEYLRDLYVEQLQTVGGFQFVRSFEVMHKERNRTLYYLIYGTRHCKGLEKMKDAMWEIDPISGTRFSGEILAIRKHFSLVSPISGIYKKFLWRDLLDRPH